MSRHAATTAAQVSPKVNWGLFAGLALTVLATALVGVTPEMLDFLGPWSVTIAGGLVAGGGYLAGYLKRDPLRDLGAETADAVDAADPDDVHVLDADPAPVTVETAEPLASLPDPETVPSTAVDADGFTAEDRALLSSIETREETP